FPRRRRHTRSTRDWSSDVCASDLTTCGFSRAMAPRAASRQAAAANAIRFAELFMGARLYHPAHMMSRCGRTAGPPTRLKTTCAEDRKSVVKGDGEGLGGRLTARRV